MPSAEQPDQPDQPDQLDQPERPGHVVCVDFGSTFTKAALVDLTEGRIAASASHPTTIDTDVLDGYDACLASLIEQDARAATAEVLACSSAGGGLRIAVVGNEELVTAEAGRRVALSSGGKVVAVIAAATATGAASAAAASDQSTDDDRYARVLGEARPDVVLLTGGTDGGNAEVLLEAARALVAAGWRGPVVVAANVDARDEVSAILGDVPHVLADNVVPRIGVLTPDSARRAIREVFLAHVIGGKHLSARPDPATGSGSWFTAMVRGATPDVVLTGVELLARGPARGQARGQSRGQGDDHPDNDHPGVGDVVVVDVGGATTDVHSVVEIDPDTGHTVGGLAREVVAPTPVTRTVEGDLGMRWSAASTVAAAGLDELAEAAAARQADPGLVPATDAERDADEAIARAAVALALRRHAGRSRVVVSPEGRVVERTGQDLREVDLLVGSGGVFRHGRPGVAERVLAGSIGSDFADGWQLPRDARVVVDADYVLAAAGLLAERHPVAAYRLVRRLVAAERE